MSTERERFSGAPWLAAAARLFEREGVPLYAVGGAVRNPLMGLPISDVDVCGPALPPTVLRLCEGTDVRAELRAAHFGTVELHVTDESGARHMAEYTTFREDSYRCGHRPERVRFTQSLEVDALRRDFSVNAIYRRVFPEGLGETIDPTGGLSHMRAGVLHTVTEDPDRVLGDDGLRILRAARFQAELDLRPTPALLAALQRHAPLLGQIARERIGEEWRKILLADLRYPMLRRRVPGAQSGLETLERAGVWNAVMDGIPWDGAAAAAMSALAEGERFPSPVALRMALLCRAAAPGDAARQTERLCFSRREIAQTTLLLQTFQALQTGELSPVGAARAGRTAMDGAVALARALNDGAAQTRGIALQATLAGLPVSLRELAVRGNDLLPLCAELDRGAARIGPALNALWERVLRGELPNQKTALLNAAREALR